MWLDIEDNEILAEIKNLNISELSEVLDSELIDQPIKLFDKLINLQKNIYWKINDLDKVLLVSDKALRFVQNHADGTPRAQSALLYNVASFTCPWWSDSLDISDEQAETGFKAANQLVNLREKFGFEPMKIAGAYWILAGHYLYTFRNYEKAVEYYNKTFEIAKQHPEDELSVLLQGNSIEGKGRAAMLIGKSDGRQLVDEAIKMYETTDDEYSKGEAEEFLKNTQKF